MLKSGSEYSDFRQSVCLGLLGHVDPVGSLAVLQPLLATQDILINE